MAKSHAFILKNHCPEVALGIWHAHYTEEDKHHCLADGIKL